MRFVTSRRFCSRSGVLPAQVGQLARHQLADDGLVLTLLRQLDSLGDAVVLVPELPATRLSAEYADPATAESKKR